MNDDTTLGGKQDDISPSATPTDNKVPGTDSELPSDQTIKPEEGTEAATTVKHGGGEEQPVRSRAAQRIGELIRENKSLRTQLEGTDEELPKREEPTLQIPTAPVAEENAEFKRAKDFLKNLGFSPTSEIKQTVKDEIQNMEARMILDSERMRLEQQFSGSDGKPKYDHDKVMQHARKTGIYNPEAAYENLYKAELLDWAIKNSQGAGSTFIEKPVSSAAPETGQLTRESIARILATPEGRKWYEENRTKILSALSKGEL